MKKIMAISALLAVVAGGARTASAHDQGWATAGKVLTGLVAAQVVSDVLAPRPVYYAPPPVYAAPAPVYVTPAPAPVYYAPPPPVVVYQPPVYYAPPVVSFSFGFGYPYRHHYYPHHYSRYRCGY